MASKIAERAAAEGITEKALVKRAVVAAKNFDDAAARLGVYPTSLKLWLKANNVTVKPVKALKWIENG